MLLLFDIDGTLLRKAHVEHREALHAAMKRVWGTPDADVPDVDAAGRTDIDIAREILLEWGYDARRIDVGMMEFRKAAPEEYARLVPEDLSDRVAPGARELLEDLRRKRGVMLSLVTGNLERIARLKLRAAGLEQYFPPDQGGFGSDAEDRSELPAIARQRAGRGRHPYPQARTVVIGDTPHDIACARADGDHSLAVAGGPYGVDQLRAADGVAADVPGLRPLLDALIASHGE